MSDPTVEKRTREDAWAKPVGKLHVSTPSEGGINLNVEGRQVVGPLQGFGPMWQKTYRVRLTGCEATPAEVVRVWKEAFPEFWPKGNRFYGPLTGIAPGEVAVLNLGAPVGNTTMLSTGVMVIYADEESFTFMTPQGHIFAGWITFSAERDEDCTVAQVQALIRANDPLYEVAFRLGGSRQEDTFWMHTLQALAQRFGVDETADMTCTCVDPRIQWSQAKNIWHNAGIRTALYIVAAPVRWVRQSVGRRG